MKIYFRNGDKHGKAEESTGRDVKKDTYLYIR